MYDSPKQPTARHPEVASMSMSGGGALLLRAGAQHDGEKGEEKFEKWSEGDGMRDIHRTCERGW